MGQGLIRLGLGQVTLFQHQCDDHRRAVARALQIVGRRTAIFERIHPFRLSASYKRFRSAFLTEEYRRTLQLEASTVEALLPATILADALSTRSIKVILSFQNWHALRFEQDLAIEEAREVVTRLLGDILSKLPD